ncbi:VenA family class IV lanthipeptide [Nocardia brasiliensis]
MIQDLDLDLVAALHALPETDPVEIEGVQFGRNLTCGTGCAIATINIQTICFELVTC